MKLATGRHKAQGSAARIVEEARRCLTESGYRALHNISCDYHEGILLLRGHVRKYYHKQLAQEFVRNVTGVDKIVNVIDVLQ